MSTPALPIGPFHAHHQRSICKAGADLITPYCQGLTVQKHIRKTHSKASILPPVPCSTVLLPQVYIHIYTCIRSIHQYQNLDVQLAEVHQDRSPEECKEQLNQAPMHSAESINTDNCKPYQLRKAVHSLQIYAIL